MSVDSTLSTLAKNWTPECSLTVEWANKLGHHPTTEVHSATKLMHCSDTNQHGRFSQTFGQKNVYGMALPVRSSKTG